MTPESTRFVETIRQKFPEKFRGTTVVDFGSLNVNGSYKELFTDCRYTGVDIRTGKDVDVVSKAHEYNCDPVDVAISGQMLEHDEYWMQSLFNMHRVLKEDGLMIVTAAGWAVYEHGTRKSGGELWGTNPDYYKGILQADLQRFVDQLPGGFKEHSVELGNQGQDIYFYGIKAAKKRVLCSISTKGRYDNYLAMAIMSVAQQTLKPTHLTIYDDNDPAKDLRDIPAYKSLLQTLDATGIKWDVVFGRKQGQHHNHQIANKAGFDFVWRLDDDCVAQPNVLASLVAQMTDGVGAVGGSILTPPTPGGLPRPPNASSAIGELGSPNKQWFRIDATEEVDHLHCSFLYRAGIVDYDLRLSNKAYREETLFTYALKLKGYKILITPCITWHFKSQEGGIRSDNNRMDYEHDDFLFTKWLKLQRSGKKLFVLNGGLGDNYMFLQAVPVPQGAIVATCYPNLFKDMGVEIISIGEAQSMMNIENQNVYAWAAQNNWTGHLIEAYKRMYEVA